MLGMLLGVLLPPITWIISYFLHNKYRRENNLSEAKGVKLGAAIAIPFAFCIGIGILALLSTILAPNSISAGRLAASEAILAREKGYLAACESNLKNIGTALEMWSADHKGQFPHNLSDLTEGENGGYLPELPVCPAAGQDTYSVSYKRSPDGKRFTIYCSGENHIIADILKDKPAFDSEKGLIEE